MLQVKFRDTKIFRMIIETIQQFNEHAEFIFNPKDGIKSLFYDGSNICVAELVLKPYDFTEWKCEPVEIDEKTGKKKKIAEYKLCIRVDDFLSILKRLKSSDELQFNYTPPNTNIDIHMKPKTGKGRHFSLPTIGNKDTKPNIETLNKLVMPNSFRVKTLVLSEAVKDCEIFDEALNFIAQTIDDKIQFIITAESSKGKSDIYIDDADFIESKLISESSCAFTIVFLTKMLKIESIAPEVSVVFGSRIIKKDDKEMEQDLPIKAVFPISKVPEGVTSEPSSVLFYLAPRVSDEDEDEEEDDDEEDEATAESKPKSKVAKSKTEASEDETEDDEDGDEVEVSSEDGDEEDEDEDEDA